MIDPQLKRGLLEVCVLAVLRREDSYGYQIIKDLSSCIEISESTLYPILRRLEAAGCLSVYSVEHSGRLRSSTISRKRELAKSTSSWTAGRRSSASMTE